MIDSLCLRCGLCCDGTMFASAEILPADDTSGLSTHHAVFISERGHRHFMQPCPAHIDRRCSIYEARPTTCRGFECRVLSGARSGAIGLDTAVVAIDRALALRNEVNRGYDSLRGTTADPSAAIPIRLTRPGFVEMSNDADYRAEHAADPVGFRERHADFFAAAAALKKLLHNQFGLGADDPEA